MAAVPESQAQFMFMMGQKGNVLRRLDILKDSLAVP